MTNKQRLGNTGVPAGIDDFVIPANAGILGFQNLKQYKFTVNHLTRKLDLLDKLFIFINDTRRLLKVWILIIALLLMNSCAPPPSTEAVRSYNRRNLINLSLGMSKSDVLRVMGTKTFSTYEGWVINNPYRTEVRQTDSGITVEILFYYTDVRERDDAVSDDELTPIVLVDGKVVGWGWIFFNDKVQKQQIDIR